MIFAPENIAWDQAPPSLPPGAQVAILEGDLRAAGPFTMRAKMPANYRIPPHWHPMDERVTILSGTMHMATGDQFDTTQGHALNAGTFTLMPARMHHYAWTTDEAIIQLNGIGPWTINYLNPFDDPRQQARNARKPQSFETSVGVQQAPAAEPAKPAQPSKRKGFWKP